MHTQCAHDGNALLLAAGKLPRVAVFLGKQAHTVQQSFGYTVGIPSLGSQDTIAPAVSQGNTTVLDWLNEEIKALGEENFFHKDYEETLVS